jgi:hypothetical protein
MLLNVYILRYVYLFSSRWNNHQLNFTTTPNRFSVSSLRYSFHRFLIRFRTYNFTFLGIVFLCCFCVLFTIPAYAFPTVREQVYSNATHFDPTTHINYTQFVYVYQIVPSDLDNRTNGLVWKTTFYTLAILGKLIPCVLLLIFSSLLIHALIVINRKSKVSTTFIYFIYFEKNFFVLINFKYFENFNKKKFFF